MLNHNIRKSVALSLYRDNLQPYKYTNILYENNFIVIQNIKQDLKKFLTSENTDFSWSRSLGQARFFKTKEKALIEADNIGGKVIQFKKALNYHLLNKKLL